MDMTFPEFIDWAIKGILGGVCFYAVNLLSQMKSSIDRLNDQVARIIERTEWHSKDIDKLDKRVVRVEERNDRSH